MAAAVPADGEAAKKNGAAPVKKTGAAAK
jgi:hypothetical protein